MSDCTNCGGCNGACQEAPSTFQKELETLINRHSQENGSNTPDFILAAYLNDCLQTFNRTMLARESWYGRAPQPLEVGGLEPLPPGSVTKL